MTFYMENSLLAFKVLSTAQSIYNSKFSFLTGPQIQRTGLWLPSRKRGRGGIAWEFGISEGRDQQDVATQRDALAFEALHRLSPADIF